MSQDETNRQSTARPRRRLIVLAASLLCLYCGSLWAHRQWLSTTYLDDDGTMHTLRLYYFSRDETRNRAIFWFYYPLHAWVLQADSTLTVRTNDEALEAARRGATVYVEDITLVTPP